MTYDAVLVNQRT